MSVKISDKDFAELLRERAKAGDPEFQRWVGLCYFYGFDIEKNYIEHVKWLKLAAEQGHAGAQCDLGYAFKYGLGVEQDLNKAVKLYRRAVDQGNATAQNNLAVCYRDGEGVTRNYDEAFRLFNLSAEQGLWVAFTLLGRMYHLGTGVEQDLAKAKKHYEKALANSDFGDEPASKAEKKDIQERLDAVNAEIAETEAKAVAARRAERKEVFISYSRKDKDYVDELRPHLKLLRNTTKIKWWDDSQIEAGEEWNNAIQGALARAKVTVLMVSANFFASDYVWREELPKMLGAAKDEGATILWLPISACAYEDTEIANYQAVTDPKPPLAKRSAADRDEVYTELVKRIKDIFKNQ